VSKTFLNGAMNIVHTALWPHYTNKNVFSDRRNSLYDYSVSFRWDRRLFQIRVMLSVSHRNEAPQNLSPSVVASNDVANGKQVQQHRLVPSKAFRW